MHSGFILLISAITVLFSVILLLVWLRTRPEASDHQQPLFSPESRSFFGQLDMAVSSHFYVFPDIPVTSVIKGKRYSRKRSLLRKLKGQTFDYLLCDRNDVTIVCAISLDRIDDNGVKQQKNLRKLCDLAAIPLLSYEEKPYRNVPTLRKQIFASCGVHDAQTADDRVNVQMLEDGYGITEARTTT